MSGVELAKDGAQARAFVRWRGVAAALTMVLAGAVLAAVGYRRGLTSEGARSLLLAAASLMSGMMVALATWSHFRPAPPDDDALVGSPWIPMLAAVVSILFWTIAMYTEACRACEPGSLIVTAIGIAAVSVTVGFMHGHVLGIPRNVSATARTDVAARTRSASAPEEHHANANLEDLSGVRADRWHWNDLTCCPA